MGTGKICLREGDGLVAMSEEKYEAEHILQRLLADYPDLLACDQIRPSSPTRWLLITQKAVVPYTEGGTSARWAAAAGPSLLTQPYFPETLLTVPCHRVRMSRRGRRGPWRRPSGT